LEKLEKEILELKGMIEKLKIQVAILEVKVEERTLKKFIYLREKEDK
jgi:hypothetical protein